MRKLLLAWAFALASMPAFAAGIAGNGGTGVAGNSSGAGIGISTITDGTNTVSSATQLTISGGTVGGVSPNATLTVTGGTGSLAVGSTAISGSTSGHILYNNSSTLGDIPTSGSGSVLLSTSPTLVTPALGTPSALVLSGSVTGSLSGIPISNSTGSFSSITNTGITGSTQCLHVNTAGLMSGTGADCGSGGGTPGGSSTQAQYNNSAAFGGSSGLTLNSTSVTNINVVSTSGYQIAGSPAFNVIGTNNGATTGGLGAGAAMSFAGSNYAFSTFFGWDSGNLYTGAGEVTCVGALSCASLTTGSHDTAIGVGAMFYEVTGQNDNFFGGDAERNATGVSFSTGVGSYVLSTTFSSNNVGIGVNAVYGNSASVQLTGTATANETITLTFTGSSIVGSPLAVTYNVGATPTSANIIVGLNAAIAASTPLLNDNIRSTFNTTISALTGVLAITHQGTSAVGDTFTVAFSTTGTETATVTGGTSALADGELIGIGSSAILGYQMTTATRLIGIGENTLASVTTAADVIAEGYLAGLVCTTCSQSVLIGSGAGEAITTAAGSTIVGYEAAITQTTNAVTAFGSFAGEMGTGTVNAYFGSGVGRYESAGSDNAVFGSNSLVGGSGSPGTGGFNSIFGANSFSSTSQTGVSNVTSIGATNGNACITCTYDIYIGYRTMDTTATSAFDQIVIAPGNTDISTTVGNISAVFYVFGSSTTPTIYATGINGTTPAVFLPGGTLTVGVASTTGGTLTLEGSTSGAAALTGGTTGVLTSTAGIAFSSSSIVLSGLTNSTAAQTGTVCWASGGLTYDNTSTCLVSSERFKHGITDLADAMAELDQMRPVSFLYNDAAANDDIHLGLLAEDVARIDPRLVVNDAEGKPLKIKYLDAIALLIKGFQEQQAEIEELRRHAR